MEKKGKGREVAREGRKKVERKGRGREKKARESA